MKKEDFALATKLSKENIDDMQDLIASLLDKELEWRDVCFFLSLVSIDQVSIFENKSFYKRLLEACSVVNVTDAFLITVTTQYRLRCIELDLMELEC